MGYSIELDDLSVSFGGRVVLDGIDLAMPERGVVTLMGPGGVGKSTLLRTICGLLFDVGYAQIDGEMRFRGAPISADHHPAIVKQKLHLANASVLEHFAAHLTNRQDYTREEQRDMFGEYLHGIGLGDLADEFARPVTALASVDHRLVTMAAEAYSDPAVLCVDEPTADLDEDDASRILEFLSSQGLERMVLFVTHNQRHARQISDYSALLAGGRIVEYGVAAQFFEAPEHDATRQYVRTGGCTLPSPNATSSELDPEFTAGLEEPSSEGDTPSGPSTEDLPYDTSRRPVPRAPRSGSSYSGPRGFDWLEPDQLGGCPKPGIVNNISYDMDALERIGVTHLVTLTESRLEPEAFERSDITSIFFPIVDMEAPTMERAFEMCERVDELLEAQNVVAYHCKAGLGRTGTMLAAQLVWWGAHYEDAIGHARSVQPRWIQADAQVNFLEQLEQAVAEQYGR